ncbi:hypothetical protein Noda2021_07250 [Candidatus Dependentiae bacterium Noda2021]|nr:hypothetical protein Noda2021_07250 [Candidatus Dependentiae bacterium Noda2021]
MGATGNTGGTGGSGLTGFTGPVGPIGPLGATGNTGQTGLTGFTGPVGARGVAGLAGAIGATGPTGFTGFTGLPGSSGASGLAAANAAFLYAYFTGATSVTGGDPVTLAQSAAVPFTTNGPISGITHTPGSTDIQILTPGRYEVLYTITTTVNTSRFTAAINGSLIPGATLYFIGSGTVPALFAGRVVFSATAGDVLTIRLVNGTGTSAVISSAGFTGANNQNVAASIIVRQIG